MENCKQSQKTVPRVYKRLQSSLVSLAQTWLGRSPPRKTSGHDGISDWDPYGQTTVLLPLNIPYACSLFIGGRKWEMGDLVVDSQCHIRCRYENTSVLSIIK